VTASYPGASARTLVETVALPIEQQVNGVEKMLYMQSNSSSDGRYTLTVTFEVGTDLDFAQVGFPPIKLDGINRIESDAEVTIDPRDWLFGRYVAKVRADEVQTMALCSNNSLGTGFDINRLKFFLKTYPYWKKDDSILISRAVATNWSAGEVACLTPEGVSVDEAIRGIDIALDDELPVLVFSFHSPSLGAGHTPYVRDADDLEALYDWWQRVFAYLELRRVPPTTVAEIMRAVAR